MNQKVLLNSLCWLTRNFQDFRGRWRLIDWLQGRVPLIRKVVQAGPIHVGRGYHIWADPCDLDGLRYFIHGINPREPISKLFSAIIHRGDLIMDIGANVGYFSILGSRLTGPKGTVHAFEASPTTARHLKIAERNPVGNIKIHPVAVSDHCGQVEFSLGPADHSGVSSIRPLGSKESIRVEVPCVAIDDYFADLERVKLIKIDVEGAEMMALRGMKKLLNRKHPYVILEMTDKFLRDLGSSPEELIEFMADAGYTAHPVANPSHSLSLPIVDQIDVLFIPPGHKTPSIA